MKLIDDKQKELNELCRQFGVKRLEVFGSATQDMGFGQESDLDFLVEYQPMSPIRHAEAYFGLRRSLKELFRREVDLLEVKAIDNPYFLEEINHSRAELYGS